MSVFVDTDSNGKIFIKEMTVKEAEIFLQALRLYYENRWLYAKSPEEREIKRLIKNIEDILPSIF
ncbi:hypothetical protein [Coprobacter sp.]|uniref:hypothetical protein n=1 Tax=Coprobacter sp. TaxID=1941478 RepID=UPI003AB727B0